ncbi:hypothetical Protein YC6258_01582 [Gynuella sunshinyii YC6258]|uniref:Uncharacterized protein n=1 Tax=Gynuella sunshinyii YC6258 TaxID=1445510 RepID=A0A0C5V283_9GAMM|nr:hypothetical Protein YC6258_01582 [Gynuella sunshinyii YC6258]
MALSKSQIDNLTAISWESIAAEISIKPVQRNFIQANTGIPSFIKAIEDVYDERK